MKTKTSLTLAALFLSILSGIALLSGDAARACTIFVLTDTNSSLFCNNEDFSNPRTRIWFLPAGEGYYGAVYVGYNNGYGQGGMNTEGLAFDWVAFEAGWAPGYQAKWHPDPSLPNERGPSDERMLETCATVDDAIAFYRHHREPGFSYAKILVADRTGASVIIGAGAKDGELTVERESQSRGFGFGWILYNDPLKRHPKPTVANGFKILRACRQSGEDATKYSNIYDLKSGDIYLYPISGSDDEVTFNLAAELKKGGHYYDMPTIHEEIGQAPRPLLSSMERFFPNDTVTNNAPAPVLNLGSQTYDEYAGQYRFIERWPGPVGRQVTLAKSDAANVDQTLSVSHLTDKTGDYLVASVHGAGALPFGKVADFVPVNSKSFIVDPVLTEDDIQLTFAEVRNGKATSVIVNWNGNIFNGTRATGVTDSAIAGAEPDIQGTWEGTLEQPGWGVHAGESPKSLIVLSITRVNGAYQANLANLGFGTQRQFDTVACGYPYVHGGPLESDGSFVGMVDPSGEKISGELMQDNQTYPMMVRRTAHPTPFPEPLTDAEFAPHAGSPLQGFWVGKIGSLRIEIKIAGASDGTFRADFYNMDQGAYRLPTAVSYDGTTVKLMPMCGYGMFEGHLRKGGNEMAGNWIQGGDHTPTTFTLLGGRAIDPAIREANYPDIQGSWEGVVHLEDPGVANGQEAQARFVLNLFKTNGVYRATIDWPDWGKKDVPMVNVAYDYPNVTIQETVRDTWSFRVSADATKMYWDRYIHFIEPDPEMLKRTTAPTPVPDPLTQSDFAPRPGSALQGYWEGEIGTGPNAVPEDLKIAERADGTFRAERDIPVHGIQGRPIIVSYKPPMVEFKPADGAGMFSGQLSGSGAELSGSWTQGGQSTPESLRRVDYQAEHAHDADKDYSFVSTNDLPGHWIGAWTVTIGKVTVQIRQALDIAKLPDGSYSATIANIDGIGVDAPVPVSAFKYSSPNLHVECKWEGWAYDGKLENGKIVGTWSEGGGGFSMVFERTNE